MIDQNSYNNNGYLLINNFFDPKEVEIVLTEAKQVFLEQFISKGFMGPSALSDFSELQFNDCLYRLFDEDLNCLMNCGKQIQHLISLHRLSLHTKIVTAIQQLGLRFPVISTRPVMYFNHPKLAKKKVFYKVDAHQDWRSMQGSLNSLVIWIPLIDINKDLGALEILPGSHLNGLVTQNMDSGFGMVNVPDELEKNFVSVEVKKGDVLIFSSFLVHRSGENISEAPRWSCHFRYNDLKDPSFIKRNYAHPYLYKPQEELITPDFPGTEEVKSIFGR